MNMKYVTRLLASYYDSFPETPLTEKEEDYAKQVKTLIDGGSLFETTNDLDFDSDEEDREIDFNSAYNLSDSSESSVSSDDEGSSNRTGHPLYHPKNLELALQDQEMRYE